jgi:hypothetical protein
VDRRVYQPVIRRMCGGGTGAGLVVTVMPRVMVPEGLCVLTDGWPVLAVAEIALLGAVRLTPATAVLAAFIVERVSR